MCLESDASGMRDKSLSLITERNKTHGSFGDNACVSQSLKAIMHSRTAGFHPVYREALDMIAVKISRILSGQSDFVDHWDDIMGYARLASEMAKRMSGAETDALKELEKRAAK